LCKDVGGGGEHAGKLGEKKKIRGKKIPKKWVFPRKQGWKDKIDPTLTGGKFHNGWEIRPEGKERRRSHSAWKGSEVPHRTEGNT